ncbi:MAG: nitronate monooxygenase [Pseudomonadales bacterium]|jgi:NAD(P)H-dependent flavin oxidoreductase YrpB (nitropropane dioxygenase family)|nr:nitronate monooxygenase [Pseudomonadales bacterium]
MAIRTRICDLLGIEHPILLAGMGGASTPELAAAVSNAGGLGVLGAAACGPRQLREWIQRTRAMTDKPFGVDTLLPASVRRQAEGGGSDGPKPADLLPELKAFAEEFMAEAGLEKIQRAEARAEQEPDGPPLFTKEFFDAQMDVIIEEKVPLYVSGLGNPGPWMERLKANGTKVGAVVGKVKHAVQVMQSGIDFIVAQGHDGGGHNSPIGTIALVPQVVDAVGDLPVLGAGGITDGRGVAAAIMLGAEGAWVGSAFLASNEAGILDFQKQAIVDASEDGTVVSRTVTGKPARIIRSLWTDVWIRDGREPLPMPWQGMISGPVLAAANRAQRGDVNPGFAGQGIGMIKEIRPAAEILADIVEGTERALKRTSNLAG